MWKHYAFVIFAEVQDKRGKEDKRKHSTRPQWTHDKAAGQTNADLFFCTDTCFSGSLWEAELLAKSVYTLVSTSTFEQLVCVSVLVSSALPFHWATCGCYGYALVKQILLWLCLLKLCLLKWHCLLSPKSPCVCWERFAGNANRCRFFV